jgi:hypothetical protein
MKRLLVLVLALCLLAPAAARAQTGGNDLLPPVANSATPAPTPTTTPTPAPTSQDTSRTTLYAIGAGLLVLFVGIGWWIARDARRAIPEHERRRGSTAEPLPAGGTPRPRSPEVKRRARARGKAQRRARRHNRPH